MSKESDRILEQWEQQQEIKRMEKKMGNPQSFVAHIMKEAIKKNKPRKVKKNEFCSYKASLFQITRC